MTVESDSLNLHTRYEGEILDITEKIQAIVAKAGNYEHERRWHDGNGHSHVRAALLGPDLFVPIREKSLVLGTWQQIVFIELDVRSRDRTLVVQLIGE